MTHPITPAAESFLQRLADELDVPPSRYEAAKRSYHSVGDWLDRPESGLKHLSPKVYIQGSFRLGTPVRPISGSEHYDIDLVCELNADKAALSQKDLKQMLGEEIRLYAAAHSMSKPGEGRRCWTLDYADEAQFHLDALPAIPDGETKRRQLEASSLSATWATTAIAITDVDHPAYEVRHGHWPHSNPKGYTEWFRSRMRVSFDTRRRAMALQERASVEDIPAYRVKTPLQEAVQLLKRHRDTMFEADPEHKPISVILTTLAGLSYSNESSAALAIITILAKMDSHIESRAGIAWIANPTDPAENFADRWAVRPERRTNFYRWLAQARSDFELLAAESNRQRLFEVARAPLGETAARSATGSAVTGSKGAFVPSLLSLVTPHKKAIPWPIVKQGTAKIERATATRNGFRTATFLSNSAPLAKNTSLQFYAKTDVPEPYDVHWQIVNTGAEAASAGGLRGGFDSGYVSRGSIVRKEGASYKGAHTIECFIVKDGYLVAQSGRFVVNIA